MKKYLLLVMISLSTIAHTQVNKIVIRMSPTDRHNLFLSTKEVADAYSSLGRTQKANSFYRSAVSIYPIGDEAHQLANQFGISLYDEETYTNFVVFGNTNFENQQYQIALYSYLMADELDNTLELYQKIAATYEALGNSEDAAFYQELSKNANSEMPIAETSADNADMDVPAYDDETPAYPVYEEGLEVEPTYPEEEEYEYGYADNGMTIEADVEAEDILSEKALSETNTVNTDGLNDIMQADYEEQLN